MAASRLTAEQKTFIVACLAQYMSASETQKAFKERYGVKPPAVSSIQHYDPRYSKTKKWLKLFEEERERFNADLSALPMQSQAWRQTKRFQAAMQAAEMGNFGLLLEYLNSGAREAAKGFGKAVEVSGPDGGPLQLATLNLDAAGKRVLAELIQQALPEGPKRLKEAGSG